MAKVLKHVEALSVLKEGIKVGEFYIEQTLAASRRQALRRDRARHKRGRRNGR